MKFPKQYLIAGFLVAILGIVLAFFFSQRNTAEPVEVETQSPKQEVIGLSVEGREIESYNFGTGENQLVFVGGIHGGYEWNSVILAYEFINYLDENPEFIPDNISISIIPSLNPDGVFKVIGKEGRFGIADVPSGSKESGRLNANKVDLNRNFDCKWKPESMWKSVKVSAGTESFSEPESAALKKFVLENNPSVVVFWHSQAGAVYSSKCESDFLQETLDITDAYSKASGYSSYESFDNYEITGDAGDWLASIKVPAISVELKTHETIEWQENLAGIKALLEYYGN